MCFYIFPYTYIPTYFYSWSEYLLSIYLSGYRMLKLKSPSRSKPGRIPHWVYYGVVSYLIHRLQYAVAKQLFALVFFFLDQYTFTYGRLQAYTGKSLWSLRRTGAYLALHRILLSIILLPLYLHGFYRESLAEFYK
jgi:hypothetical protein